MHLVDFSYGGAHHDGLVKLGNPMKNIEENKNSYDLYAKYKFQIEYVGDTAHP
jgi:hypothetical protein